MLAIADWHWTWQDPAALALALAGLAFAFWARRRFGGDHAGCGDCPSAGTHHTPPGAPPTGDGRVSLTQTRLGRREAGRPPAS